MKLRSELMPPVLDEALVHRLAALAAQIDCGDPEQTKAELAAFNREALTDFDFYQFQGIYGGQEHETWVRNVLAGPYVRLVPDVSKDELVEMVRRLMEAEGTEEEMHFWLCMLEVNVPDEQISDLIYWPGEYFGDVDYPKELSAEQLVDIALARAASVK